MKTPFLRALALTAAVVAVLLPQTIAVAATSGAVDIPLKANVPATLCLTDSAATALDKAGIAFEAVAPATVVTEDGHPCLHMTVERSALKSDLSGVQVVAVGGFALRQGTQRSEFTDTHAAITPLDPTIRATLLHNGQRTETLNAQADKVKLSLTGGVDARDIPITIAPAAADAITADIPDNPLRGGDSLFIGNAQIGVQSLL